MCKGELKKQLTWEELAKHNKRNDALVAVRGKIYNVTEFMKRHPGGEDVLLTSAGRDVTQVFEMYHPFSTAKVLKKYEVGDLLTQELPVFPEPSPFFVAIKQRVEDYFVQTKQDPKFAPAMFFRYFFIVIAIALSWYAQLFVLQDSHIGLSIVAAAVLGFASALVGMLPMHDASHFTVTHRPWVWKAVGSLHDFFNGASYLVWCYQHFLGHHPYTNIDGADPDIVTADNDVRRIKSSQRWYSFYWNQHIYVPMLYTLLAIKTRLQDISILFVLKRNGAIRVNDVTNYHKTIFWAGKIFWVMYRIVFPFALLPFWKAALLFVVSDAVASLWLSLTFQANHVVGEVEWPTPDANNAIKYDWAEMQVLTSQDYAHDSWFFNLFTGALNHQTTHHLFPGISQYYYPQISPIVMQTCKEFGVRHNYKATFTEALGCHLGYLKRMGRQSQDSVGTTEQLSAKNE